MYNEFGWTTFPCHGKIPATPRGFKDGDKTGEIFKKYPAQNIGIVTGTPSGIFVLDVDVKINEHGVKAQGAESLAALIAKNGQLPDTVEARTWSGGTHYFFNLPKQGIGCRTNFHPGLDIRGEGGYVVAPPSVVHGKPYEWLRAPGTMPIADAPPWLLATLKNEKISAPASQGTNIEAGNRNSELTSRAGRMRAAGMDAGDIFQGLLKINSERCNPPLPEKEVRIIAESVGRYDVGNTAAPLTDLWNCERFTERFGENLKWCDSLGGWYVWDGVAWRRRDDNALLRMAKDFVKTLTVQAESTNDKRLKVHAIKSESSGKLSAVVELSKSEPNISADFREFDKNNNLLNCSNGTLNLDTGEIRDAKREDMITKALDIAYDPGAGCLVWLKFLDQIFQGEQDIIEYVQCAVGYCLSGHTSEQKFFICFGNGRNGKSTLLKHIMYILGESYSSGTPAETMLESDGNTLHAVASLKGMRMVVLNEFDEGKAMSCSQVKVLTGGEPVIARHLYHEQFCYVPTYKFFMTTNHKPRIKDTSLGIWRRLVLLPFDYTVAPDQVDIHLDAKLAAEHPGILAWAVKGYQKWRNNGLPSLDRLKKEAACYQSESDLIGQFLEDVVDTDAEPSMAHTAVVDFITAMTTWCRENGVKYIPGRSAVIDYMNRRGYGRPARLNGEGKGRLSWKGINIKGAAACAEPKEW